jgi:hypothetical protein
VVKNLVVNASTLTLATAETKAVAGGVLSGAGSDASVTQVLPGDGVSLIGARITVANDANVNAASLLWSKAVADGENVLAGFSGGVSQAAAGASPHVRIQLIGVDLNAGGNVSIGSSAQAQSRADATASSRSLANASGATVTPTNRSTSVVNTVAGTNGVPTRVVAGGNLTLKANAGEAASGLASSPSYSFVTVGKATAAGYMQGGAFADIGAGTVLYAGTDLTVEVNESKAYIPGQVSFTGGPQADGQGNSASSSLTHRSVAKVDIGDGAALTAPSGRLTVSANGGGGGGNEVSSSAAARLFPSPSYPSKAETNINSSTEVNLGNSALTGRNVFLSANSNVLVTNVGSGGFGSLTQHDAVNVTALVTSGQRFQLTLMEIRGGVPSSESVTASATAAASDGMTNRGPRTTIDSLTKKEEVPPWAKNLPRPVPFGGPDVHTTQAGSNGRPASRVVLGSVSQPIVPQGRDSGPGVIPEQSERDLATKLRPEADEETTGGTTAFDLDHAALLSVLAERARTDAEDATGDNALDRFFRALGSDHRVNFTLGDRRTA